MNSVPPIPGLTRYTHRDQVPDGLHTRTELREMGLNRGSDPVGQLLYHGSSYAPLYERSAAVPRRAVSPARRTALARARSLRYTCRRCTATTDRQLPRGRLCPPCSRAVALRTAHDQARQLARELVADPHAALLVVNITPGTAPAVAVIGVRDHHLLYTAPAGADGSAARNAVLGHLDALLEDRQVVQEPKYAGPIGRYPYDLIRRPDRPLQPGRDPHHPWTAPHSTANHSIEQTWAQWFAWTAPGSTTPGIPRSREGIPIPWTRTTDPAADGRSMTALLHRIADGTEPTWDQAAWLDGHDTPEGPTP